jgi:hypothetical protein
MCSQHKKILERTIPDVLKLSIARKIENNLFSKVCQPLVLKSPIVYHSSYTCVIYIQITFLVGLSAMGEMRTLFTAEV